MTITISKYLSYEKNNKLFALAFSLSLLSFVIYDIFFDILVPFIPGGSVRSNSGVFFVLPVFLLLGCQTLFVTYLIHVTVKAADQSKRDLLKSYLVASFEIFLFSIFYVIFPYYGPYTYIVYFMPDEKFSKLAYPMLILWTLVIIVATASLFQRLFKLNNSHIGWKRNLILAATILAVTIGLAS